MKVINNKGFGTIALVLAMLVLAIAVSAGVYITKNKDTSNNSSRPSVITNFEQCVAAGNPIMESYPEQCAANGKTYSNPNQKVENTPTSNNKKYLEIKEWGIRFSLEDVIKDAYYHVFPDRPLYVYFSTESLRNIDECSADQTSLAGLGRFKENDTDELRGGLMKTSYPDSPKVGEYYYYMSGAQARCTDDEAAQKKATDGRAAFLKAEASIEAIPSGE